MVLVGLAIDQIAQSGLSSLSVIYYSAQLFSEEEIKRVVVLNKLTDKEEIETKIVAFLKERHLKVADYE
ncbi:hypothetical protein [Klebsiella pneumoniae]|uniref:hypothetical protein n=1 Tax=Klebsiella pneumoniae TaxID=573 RepID=UPI003CF8CDA7